MSDQPPTSARNRSTSRGRDFYSSGRGGAGNIRHSSSSPDARPVGGPDDYSATRGREMAVTPKITHSGRGGAGNIRSPSRDAHPADLRAEHDALAAAVAAEHDLPHSFGRGGLGNISRSRSRSPSRSLSRGRRLHSSGRGGAGNIGVLESDVAEEEEERWEHRVPEGVHSTGRGGFANLTASPVPPIDSTYSAHEPQYMHSAGRGGVGNIRSASKQRASLDGSKEHK